MKFKVPNLKQILKPVALHNPGYGIKTETGRMRKQSIWEQGSTPEDDRLLTKLGIKKGERVLAIAGYYASWASALQEAGARVTYSDISKAFVDYIRKRQRFEDYICSNYELIPRESGKYDWTFTFEACGGKRGLVLAYLRSLLNTKGGILALLIREDTPEKMGSKLRQYPLIVKTLADIYKARAKVKEVMIRGHRKGRETGNYLHQISILRTNQKARRLAELDLRVLEQIQDKRKVGKDLEDSVKRLARISRIISSDCLKEVEL